MSGWTVRIKLWDKGIPKLAQVSGLIEAELGDWDNGDPLILVLARNEL